MFQALSCLQRSAKSANPVYWLEVRKEAFPISLWMPHAGIPHPQPLKTDFLEKSAGRKERQKHHQKNSWHKLTTRQLRARPSDQVHNRLLLGRSYDDVPIGYPSLFAALKIDGTWQCFVTVERSTGDAENLLMMDDGLGVLYDGDRSAD
jgi:hypothetical protein